MQESAERRILVVDDEPNIVNAVRRELHAPPFDFSAYAIDGYTDPVLALQRASEVAYDAVISDYRMPTMDGIAFLCELARMQPDCMRLVLSGQSDFGTLARLVNESRIYRFIAKPWNAHYLKAALAQSLDYGEVLRENRRLVGLAAAHGLAPAAGAETGQVLIVDDDRAVVNSLSRALRPPLGDDGLFVAIRDEAGPGAAMVGEASIHAAHSAAEALRMAEATDFSCIVSDFRMPEMNGVELLKRFAARQPDCTRILISGQIERDDLLLAINQAHIFAFLDKPWTDHDLKAGVLLGLSRHRMLLENRRLVELVR
jgi:response regulator RpfG family c-di-GMP phosphodiesterase